MDEKEFSGNRVRFHPANFDAPSLGKLMPRGFVKTH
jgi:hypothetical protein